MLYPKENVILSHLSAQDRALLDQDFEAVDLPIRSKLCVRDRRIEHVYFLDSGIASVVAHGPEQPIEIGMIGREGMSALSVIMGSERSDHEVYMQVAGAGRRIRADILRNADERSLTLHRVLIKYAYSFLLQISSTALANGRSNIEERLARWLLLSHDRTDGNELAVTHELLSLMLGTPRPSVTLAVQQLTQEKLIDAGRRKITIVDRKGLEAKCTGIYEPALADLTDFEPPKSH